MDEQRAEYVIQNAAEFDADESAGGRQGRLQRVRDTWSSTLNSMYADGYELVTEHVSETLESASYWGTFKFRHDTDSKT